jgi:uncharacterized protein (DUF1800 family)
MALLSVSARKRRKKKKKHHVAKKHPVPKKHPAPKKHKSAPPPQPAPKPAPPHAPTPAPGTGGSGTGTAGKSAALVATSRERLFLNRFGTGFTQDALKQLRAAGTTEAWLEQQMNPTTVTEAAKVATIDGWFSYLRAPVTTKAGANGDGSMPAWKYGHNLGNWTILRRIYSRRSVLETMTDFWSTNLHIPVGHDRAWLYRADYDATIRQHAFGTFEEILLALSLHPAMRVYLDNWSSVKNKPNENQGRELLELHTVGRAAGYSEAMVKDSAKILSGYTVDWGKTYEARYDQTRHTTGAVSVLGFDNPNAAADGQAVTEAYLKYLAHHPSTASNLCRKLATYFVSDAPSDGLVASLAQVYLANGTDMKAVLRALAAHPEFLLSQGQKVRTPVADMVATARVLNIDVQPPGTDGAYADNANWSNGGPALFSWPRPDGPPVVGRMWSSASRVFASYDVHLNHAGGWWPKGATYRSAASWLPASSVRFDDYVEHLSRTWLGKSADSRIQKAATQAVNGPEAWAHVTADTEVTAKHSLGSWLFPRLVIALLDTPDHMTS